MKLEEFFSKYSKVALGFSGGVDSAYLLYVAKENNCEIQPYFIKSPFQPQFELMDAYRVCNELDIELKVIEYDILQNQKVKENPDNRCYYCKKELFTLLKEHAKKDGYSILIDGTNASDDIADRPGYKALNELQVLSPLRECGITKKEVRELSKEAGLFTWNKPSYACLATRIQANQEIDKETLEKVELAEGVLSNLGYKDFRVRVYYGAARIQMKEDEWYNFAQDRERVYSLLKPIFDIVLFDMETR
ncbi:MAG: ATP-dependent sacrificial sulfur transferase LarE [Bacillota bacterium]|nr:ATP-dependent sacrificial sulfur transferase LarE [Bacillota bacterium]